jgi:hypothetical protein
MRRLLVQIAACAPGVCLAAACWLHATSVAAEEPGPADAAGLEHFEQRIRPLLAQRCYECHGPDKQKNDLRLDSRAGMLQGGASGAAVVPGDVEASLLVQAIRYTDDFYQMPPTGKLPAEEITLLEEWIARGAPAPDDAAPAAAERPPFDLAARRAEHWCWQPLAGSDPPEVRNAAWVRSPIDRFVLARLEAAGLAPAPETDRRTWLRRVTFDLIGLPPKPEEIAAFLGDDSPEAYEHVVERLLASEHYGEHWARHWLDLVRYAETRGHEFDYPIPNAWQYRDYLIRAFNADVPYDQFVTEHLAGDLVQPPRVNPVTGANESVLGTGGWLLGEEVHSPVDIRLDAVERTDNKLDVLGKAFLGLTIACARCHDHKFDAISAADYYALSGFLQSASYRQVRFETLELERRVAAERAALARRAADELLPALVRAQQPIAERAAECLLAARQVVLGEANAETAAADRGLNAAVVASWAEHLFRAKEDEHDPLHAWAVVASDPSATTPQRLEELLRLLLDGQRAQSDATAAALGGATVLVDYRTADEPWLPDGFAFGPGPRQLGEMRLGSEAARPIEICCEPAAWYDPAYNALQIAADNEGEPGQVNWVQAGRTLRTRTFTPQQGRLFYLVRGGGRAYAAVDLHRMVNGPLHGQLVRGWEAATGWQWVEHDLTKYAGHRVHVEFTPADGAAEFAVALVVEADRAPGQLRWPNSLIWNLLRDTAPQSLEELAEGLTSLLAAAQAWALDPESSPPEDVRAAAQIARWMAEHGELFLTPESAEALVEATTPFIAEEARLRGELACTSHTAPALLEGSGVDELLLPRGNHKLPGAPVPRRFLEAVAGASQGSLEGGSGRLELARRMTDPANPLLPRVLVNRLWHHLLGRGIVPSVDNFGVLGERPTHPELLDWLAADLVQNGWSIKGAIRQIVLSSTYRMSSHGEAVVEERDPQNLLWHRTLVRRLQAEQIRDALLAVSGRLDPKLFGPSVPTHLTPFMEGRGRPGNSGPLDGDGRRSIYLGVRRNFLNPLFLAFDYPIPFNTIGRRTVSNVPAQALALLNDPLVVEQSRLWAVRLLADPALDGAGRVERMHVDLFGRPPTDDERAAALAFVEEQSRLYGAAADDPRAWQDLAHVLVNVKEFVFLH